MVGQFWEVKDIARHLGVTIRVAEHAMKREKIEPIARASRLRLYLKSQVEEAAAAVAKTRHYTMPEDNDNALPAVGHVSALGIALAAGVDEDTITHAIEAAGVQPDHIDAHRDTPMFTVEDGARIVALVASVGQVEKAA